MSPDDARQVFARMQAAWTSADLAPEPWLRVLADLAFEPTMAVLRGLSRDRQPVPTLVALVDAVRAHERTAPPDLETARRGIDRCRSALEAAAQRRDRP